MDKADESGELTEANIDTFRIQFTNFVRDYCGSALNSSTITIQKKERIIKYLKDCKSEPSARFRFWVRSKGFRIVQITDEESILAVPSKTNDPNDPQALFRRVPIIDEFFDIIYAAHCENGHVGQAQTFSAVKAMYAMIPRIMIIRFIEMCPQCSTSHIYMAKRRRQTAQQGVFITPDKLTGANPFGDVKRDSDQMQDDTFDAAEDVNDEDNQQDMANTLSELLSVKMAGPDLEGDAAQVKMEDLSSDPPPGTLAFSCHLCKHMFTKRKALQKHILSHQDYRPSVPLQKISPQSRKRRLNVEFASSFLEPSPRRMRAVRKRVILDVNSSPSTAQAIFLAASRPDIELMAINCVAGPLTVLNACENTLRVLKACGREDVHVCRGAEKSLLGLAGRLDNLPGSVWSTKFNGHIQAEHSVSSLIRCVNENPGEISLVCLGPLTNLALALRLDPLIATNLRELIIVGGNIEGQGNVSSCSEQNFLFDPEAAHIVLQEVQDATILPFEVSQRHSIPFKQFSTWLNTGTDISNFLIESVTQEDLQQQAKVGVASPEVFAIAMIIDPSIVLEREKIFVTVELKGDHSRGLMVVDRMGHLGKPENMFVLKNLDLSKTQALFGALFVIEPVASATVLPVSAPQTSRTIVCLTGSGGVTREHTPVLFKDAKVTIL
ncbi:hypothetical protein EGW08_017184 [Elysia chlorotica]|uniref:C2H2-type domain-containing protein n=1 Tax=Elysia chlorotica TaxID=188477 RepID=A0A3S0ZD83_ELYCH|nr:hypothetical protein EGW08_017184 [Elysia chlorotica]